MSSPLEHLHACKTHPYDILDSGDGEEGAVGLVGVAAAVLP